MVPDSSSLCAVLAFLRSSMSSSMSGLRCLFSSPPLIIAQRMGKRWFEGYLHSLCWCSLEDHGQATPGSAASGNQGTKKEWHQKWYGKRSSVIFQMWTVRRGRGVNSAFKVLPRSYMFWIPETFVSLSWGSRPKEDSESFLYYSFPGGMFSNVLLFAVPSTRVHVFKSHLCKLSPLMLIF